MKLILSLFVCIFLSSPVFADIVAITGGTIFKTPVSEPIENGIIVISDGKITNVGTDKQVAVPESAKIVDATGKFIVAGFWNSHVHYMSTIERLADKSSDQLQEQLTNFFLRWGFVTTVDVGSYLSTTLGIKKRIETGDVDGPRIITMSGSFVPEGGSPIYIKPIKLPEFTDEKTIDLMIENVLQGGADGIKIFSGSWSGPSTVVLMKPEYVREATKAAHKRNVMVMSHPSDSDGARIAIENGVDILAHTFPSEIKGPWDKTLPKKMANRNMALVPTLKLLRIDLTKLRLPSWLIDRMENNAIEQTSAAHKLGVQILFGTDVGYIDDNDTTEEYILMERAGLDYKSILASLTTEPAKRFGFGHSEGKIKQGYNADLVLLGSDPRQKITAFSDVHKTIRNGRVIFDKQ